MSHRHRCPQAQALAFAALLLSSVLWTACAKTRLTTHHTAESERGMVVSAHVLASQVGRDVLRAGGNATDAAIATQLALAVVCPRAGNLGGGGFWVYAPAGEPVRTFDYREKAPAAATRDMYLLPDGTVDTQASLAGPLAAGIPGQLDGMHLAFSFGTKLNSWQRLVEPAARLARQGFAISSEEAARLNAYRSEFVANNDFDFPFVKDTPWRAGDVLVQTQLAETLDSVALVGAKYFYDTGFAERLVAEVRARGGIWTLEDLKGYFSTYRAPIHINFRGLDIYTMGPPSSGGVALAQLLGMLDGYDLADLRTTDTTAYVHLLIEAMRRAYQDRAVYLGDPEQVRIPVDSLRSTAYLRQKWSTFDPDSATDSGIALRAQRREVYETTHTSVIDSEGNAVSVTTTLNGNYGCKTWSRTGGFFLNNEMDDFSAKPGVPNQFGLVGGEANAIAPGKRMLSSMTPTIVQREGQTVLVLGSPGGSTIITAVLQVMLNELVHKQDLSAAIAEGRIHHQWLPDEVLYEPGALSERVLQQLRRKGHELRQVESIGRVKAIAKTPEGKLLGVGDARNPDDAAAGH